MMPRSTAAIAATGTVMTKAQIAMRCLTDTVLLPAPSTRSLLLNFPLGCWFLRKDLCQQLRLEVASADDRYRLPRRGQLATVEEPCCKCHRSAGFRNDSRVGD